MGFTGILHYIACSIFHQLGAFVAILFTTQAAQALVVRSYYFFLSTERAYKWKVSGSARQSEIGILCFDWLIHPGAPYSREI